MTVSNILSDEMTGGYKVNNHSGESGLTARKHTVKIQKETPMKLQSHQKKRNINITDSLSGAQPPLNKFKYYF